jgi:hypothetical protein
MIAWRGTTVLGTTVANSCGTLFGVGEVGDDESRHVRQSRDRARKVFAGWLLEIKQGRQVVALAKFVSNRVQNGFSFRREAAQNDNYFGSNGVDNTTNFFVIQKQVDELGHFEIVNLDWGLIPGGDYQILLDRSCRSPNRCAGI